MESASQQSRSAKRAHSKAAAGSVASTARRRSVVRAEAVDEKAMLLEARSRRMEAVRAHPVAELMECPPEVESLLNRSAKSIPFKAGEVVFRQSETCKGLYLIVSGIFLRRTERMETRLSLGPAHAGDLVELASALGDCRHTYTLVAQNVGSVLMLPMEVLFQAFQSYPPLRMRLLEELAREVSRAYDTCCSGRKARPRWGSTAA